MQAEAIGYQGDSIKRKILSQDILVASLLAIQTVVFLVVSYFQNETLTTSVIPEMYVAIVLLYSVFRIKRIIKELPPANGLSANEHLLCWHSGLFIVYCLVYIVQIGSDAYRYTEYADEKKKETHTEEEI